MRAQPGSLVQIAILLTALAVSTPGVRAATLPYQESFPYPDGSAWPAPWFAGSAHVTLLDIQSGRARWAGDPTWVARMILPGFAATDVEATLTVEFEDVAHQGIGFYVRQNGGTLREYVPFGQGYALFLKGAWGWPEDLGLWREIAGIETQFAARYDPLVSPLQDHVRYRLRYRVTQQDAATTLLQAKVWAEAASEPLAWTIEATDTRAELQGFAGSFALDIYNFSGSLPVYVDDLAIEAWPPVSGIPLQPASRSLALSPPRPQPLRSGATYELTTPEGGHAEVVLLDVRGRRVSDEFRGGLSAGTHTMSLSERATRQPSGVYLLVARLGAERTAQRVVITR
ncbi:MAG: hypothetical protein ABL977_06110 [Candidatus Eisenbacteria bacterium]